MNIELYVAVEDEQCIVVKKKGWDTLNGKYDLIDRYDYRIKFEDGVLVVCDGEDFEAWCLCNILEDGVDFSTGVYSTLKPVLYDLPEWGLKDYTVGEIILEVYRRVTAKYYVTDWVDYVKYLRNGDKRFKQYTIND